LRAGNGWCIIIKVRRHILAGTGAKCGGFFIPKAGNSPLVKKKEKT